MKVKAFILSILIATAIFTITSCDLVSVSDSNGATVEITVSFDGNPADGAKAYFYKDQEGVDVDDIADDERRSFDVESPVNYDYAASTTGDVIKITVDTMANYHYWVETSGNTSGIEYISIFGKDEEPYLDEVSVYCYGNCK